MHRHKIGVATGGVLYGEKVNRTLDFDVYVTSVRRQRASSATQHCCSKFHVNFIFRYIFMIFKLCVSLG